MVDDNYHCYRGLTPTLSEQYRQRERDKHVADLSERVAKLERANKRAVTRHDLDLVTTALTNVLRDTLREIDEKIETKSASV
jgi:hypothetical protein